MIAAYCRVSSEDQRERHTIESQRRILAEYAEDKSWEIFDWYVDDGLSGTTIEDRPEFSRLLEDATRQLFNIVLVTDADRLPCSNDLRQRAHIEYTLQVNGGPAGDSFYWRVAGP